jgi:hypothetical protein
MAKRKNSKKDIIKEEIVELIKNEEVINENEVIEEIDTTIELIDMSEDIKEIEKEIFEEPKKEEPKIEEKPKNKFTNKFNQMIGYIWNGVEYDY